MITHPGGPFWAKKDVWSIPKGELNDNEDYLAAARREFKEELDLDPPAGDYIELGSAKQSDGKVNFIWAVEGELDLSKFQCTSLEKMEWPPGSGKRIKFPEIDKVQWFDISEARQRVFQNQAVFFDRLAERLGIKITVFEDRRQSLL